MFRTGSFALSAAVAVVAAISWFALAQQQPAKPNAESESSTSTQSALKKQLTAAADQASAPTAEHKLLAPFVGEFDEITEARVGPGEPLHACSTAKGRWILGARFVGIESRSAPDEELKGERLLFYGYDPQAKKFTLVNFESSSLTATSATGEYDAATKTFTFDGERDEPGRAGAPASKVPFRWTVKVEPTGVLLQQILVKPPGAPDYVPVVKVTHTPKAK